MVPDGSAARRVRRLIVERGACSGVVVGSWSELIEHARRAYLVPRLADDWEAVFSGALAELEDAFWSESLSVAPVETSVAVSSALALILSATDPARGVDEQGLAALPERPRRHLADLLRLTRTLAGRLPGDLSTIRNLLSAEMSYALYSVRVYHVDGVPFLTRWQAALVEKLNRDAEIETDARPPGEVLANILRGALTCDSGKQGRGALGLLQSRLFGVADEKAELDESVQWVGVRDFFQEAEVAAGMVQTLLAEHPQLEPADIGLLLPDSLEYSVAVRDAFRLGGLALSGLAFEGRRRDLGREAVFHFLHCRQDPAPAMALAVCLGSPLMPWSREDGAELAQAVMAGDYRLRPPAASGRNVRAMLDLLRDGDVEPRTLVQALERFVALLASGDDCAGHIQQASAAVEQIRTALKNATEIDWAGLRRTVSPRLVSSGACPDFNLEGVTVWRESQEPWRAVRCLIVLGFAQGHYPLAVGSNSVFSADDIRTIRECVGLAVSTVSEEVARRRLRFARQLGAVSDAVTFLISRRDPSGAVQVPSESLVFMHQLFMGPPSADELIAELDIADDRVGVRHLALADLEPPRPPRVLLADDMCFDRDLMVLRTAAAGRLKPESPSSLETLMVSPLAWLLRRLEAEPLQWAPAAADVSLLGTLAHQVFEALFRPGKTLPGRDEISVKVDALLDQAIRRSAPFLMASQWQVERRHFAAQTSKAAQVWRDVLERLGAEVLASEAWLQGTWSGISIHGQTDLILGLPGGRLLVVDYKRSKSSNRRQRMHKGYDSQASLYRAMLRSGGPKNSENELLVARIRTAAWTGIVYYMLNDQVSLSDAMLPESITIPGWQALENDVAGRAMALIQRRLAETRAGDLRLNRDGDAEFFEKRAGVKPYALENSPLIGLFTLPGDTEEAE